MNIPLKSTYLLLFLFLSIQSYSKTIHVNTNLLNGNNNGTSWQDAYTDFQDAINEAAYGDTIWVAQGTYFPTNDTLQEISFELKNGVKWFGGFQGNETELTERDFELYPTVLNGDIGVIGDSLDNSYHVVYTISTDSMTIMDGFIITNGNAEDLNSLPSTDNDYGGGLLIDASVDNPIARPKIFNCTFENNNAFHGGGISYGGFYNNFHINPQVTNCRFIQNRATVHTGTGGAISVIYGSSTVEESIVIKSCWFEGNQASFEGGGVYLEGVTNECDFIGCNFINNSTMNTGGIGGGGVSYFSSGLDEVTKLSFFECQFLENSSSTAGAILITALNAYANQVLGLEIQNSFFENNSSNFLKGTVISCEGSTRNQSFIINNTKFVENLLLFLNYSHINSILFFEHSPVITDVNDKYEVNISNSEFIDNMSECIAFYGHYAALTSYSTLISNTVFKGNIDVVSLFYPEEDLSDVKILNCTFLENDGHLVAGNSDSTDQITIANSIFWEDQSVEEMFDDGNSDDGILEGFNIHHSLFKSSDCMIDGVDVCGDGMLYNMYPEFRDTVNGDYSLRSCSPALNQGDNESIDTLGIFLDIEGTPRYLDQVVDLGAYETQAFEIFTPQASHVSCNGGSDGGIIWVQHGTPPYLYEWDNGVETGTDFTNLSAGNYMVSVVDADSCSQVFQKTVGEPLPITITPTITNATAATNADGMIVLTSSGGTPDYQYLWSNGDTTAMLENLLPGIFTVIVTDANGCFVEVELEVDFTNSIEEVEAKDMIQLLPNLIANGTSAHLVFEIKEKATFEIELFTEVGQLIFSKKIKINRGRYEYSLPVLEEAGLYFLKIKKEKGSGSLLKLVVI